MSVATTLKLPSAHPAASAWPVALCSATLATTDRNRPAISPTAIAGVLRSCVVAAAAPFPLVQCPVQSTDPCVKV